MSDHKIHVYSKRVGEIPRSVWISPTLANLQRTVGGYIETVTLARDLVIICDEEGRIKDKPYNCTVCGCDFRGDIIFCGVDGDDFGSVPVDYQTFKKLFPQLWEKEEEENNGFQS